MSRAPLEMGFSLFEPPTRTVAGKMEALLGRRSRGQERDVVTKVGTDRTTSPPGSASTPGTAREP